MEHTHYTLNTLWADTDTGMIKSLSEYIKLDENCPTKAEALGRTVIRTLEETPSYNLMSFHFLHIPIE